MTDLAQNCPICRSPLGSPFFELKGVPTLDGAVCDTLDEAKQCPIGDVALALCEICGWIGNAAFDPSRLNYEKYHFSLHHSPAFDAFIAELIDGLASEYNLAHGKVLDVGCGSGDFLRAFADRIDVTGLGIDPSITPGTEPRKHGTVTYERGLLEPRHAEFDADLLCCRHVLNSMPDPVDLLKQIHAVANRAKNPAFFFEVPHANQTFDHDLVWNVAYEHHNWFNEISFRVLCERAGYEVTSIWPCWREEYLKAECRLAEPRDAVATPEEIAIQKKRVSRFADTASAYAAQWGQRLAKLKADGKRVAMWGAGARALLFLNHVENAGHVGMLVDINPTRQDMYLAHVGTRIDAPEKLREFNPDLLLISNSAFADEIKQQASDLGLSIDTEVF